MHLDRFLIYKVSHLVSDCYPIGIYLGKAVMAMCMVYRSFNHHPAKCILCVGAGNALLMSLKSSSVREISRLRALSSTWAMLLALDIAITF